MKPSLLEFLTDLSTLVLIGVSLALGVLLCRVYGAPAQAVAVTPRSPVAFVSGGWEPRRRRLWKPAVDPV